MAETPLSSEDRQALGPTLAEVADATSIMVALKLSEHLGGRHVQVPKVPSPQSPLVKAVGSEAAVAICERLAGGWLYVPIRPGERVRIRVMRAAGIPVCQIARHLNCSERHVYRVLAEADDRQLSLI